MIDADVHLEPPKVRTLYPYMPEHWIEHIQNTLFKGPAVPYHPKGLPSTRRLSRVSGAGPKRVGTSLDDLRAELLDPEGVEVAITSCLYSVDSVHNPDAAMACAQAANDWMRSEWLEADERLRGSIVVPVQLPVMAAAEIERVAAADPERRFVQVLLPVRTEHPLGNRLFHPMWEAIERHGLVAGIHFGGAPVMPPTPTGWPSTYLEEYVAMAGVFATQLTSMIVEGVFDQFPGLRVSFLESGFTWLPAHLWRMDKEWRNLRRLVPWVRKRPSDYVREHVRVGIQPLDRPPTTAQLLEVVDQLECDDLLLYTSDFPHQHLFDAQAELLEPLRRVDEALGRRILSDNARAHYQLELAVRNAAQAGKEIQP